MPGDKVIGRVAVKVLPDTSDFRRDAKRKLDALENSLEFVVPTKADMTGAQRDLIQGIRDINARNRALDSRKIRVYTTVSTAGIDEEFGKALRKIQERANSRKLKLNTEVVGALVDLQLDPKAKDRLKQELADFQRDNSPLKIDVQLNLVQASTAATSARLAFLTRPRTVPIIPYVQQGAAAQVATTLAALSGARLLGTILDDVTESLLRLDKNIPIIGSLALAVAGLSGYGLTAASNLASLSVSLAQIIPAALVLPGILTGIGISLGVLVVALSEFTTRVPEVKAAMTELSTAIGDNFWAGAEQPIRNFIDTLLPQFVAGVEATATSLGTFMGNLAASLTGAFDGVLNQMFTDLAESISIAAGATNEYASIITILGTVGASYLPRLAQWFVDITTQFENFLSKAAEDGRLGIWIETALVNLSALGSSLVSIVEIFGGIGQAAQQAGGSSLTIFADTLERISTLVNSPAFQTQLTAVFSAAHTAMERIGAISGPAVTNFFGELAQVLTNILPIVGDTIGALLDGITSGLAQPELMAGLVLMFDGIRQGVSALVPAFAPLGAALGSIATLIGTLAAAFGPVIAAAIVPLATAFQQLVPVIQPLITMLAGALVQAITAVTPAFLMLVGAIGGLISGGILPALSAIFAALVPVIATLATTLAQILVPIIQILAPILVIVAQVLGTVLTAIAPLVVAVLQLVAAALTPLLAAVGTLAAEYLPKLGAAIVAVVNALLPVVAALTAVVGFIMPILIPVLQFLAGLLIGAVVGAFNGVANVVSGVVSVFQGFWNYIAGIFTGDWPRMWEGVKQIFTGVWTFIKGLFEVIINVTFLKGAKLLFSGLKTIFTGGWNAIKTVSTELFSSLRSRFTEFLTALKNAPGAFLAQIKTFFKNAWDDIKSAATLAFESLNRTILDKLTGAVNIVKGLPAKVKAGMGNLLELLPQAGRDLIEGFIRGFTGKVDEAMRKIADAAQRIAGAAKKALGINSPSRVFKEFGVFSAQGYEVGFVDEMKSVTGRVQDIFDGLSTIDIKPVTVGAEMDKTLRSVMGALEGDVDGAIFKQFVYNAAPNQSLDSEEDLFAALDRGRADW